MGNHSKCFKCGELDEFCACIPASTAASEQPKKSATCSMLDIIRTMVFTVDQFAASSSPNDPPPWALNSPVVLAARRLCYEYGYETGDLIPAPAASEQQASVSELPPLPKAKYLLDVYHEDGRVTGVGAYIDDDMRDYARAARARCATTVTADTEALEVIRTLRKAVIEAAIKPQWADDIAKRALAATDQFAGMRAALSGRATIPSDADERAPSDDWIMDEYKRIVAYPERLSSGDYATAIKLVRAALTHRATTAEQIHVSVNYPDCQHVAPVLRVVRSDGRLDILVEGRATTATPGYKLAPIEPTLKMLAALGFGGDVDLVIGHAAISEDLIASYKAMLEATPDTATTAADQQGDTARDAARFEVCKELSHGLSDEHGEFVVVQLPRPEGVFRCTADVFVAAIDQERAAMAAPATSNGSAP